MGILAGSITLRHGCLIHLHDGCMVRYVDLKSNKRAALGRGSFICDYRLSETTTVPGNWTHRQSLIQIQYVGVVPRRSRDASQ